MITFKCILIAWIFTKFDPIIWFVESNQFSNQYIQFTWSSLICPKCFGFWLCFFSTFDIFNAIICSIVTSFLHKRT